MSVLSSIISHVFLCKIGLSKCTLFSHSYVFIYYPLNYSVTFSFYRTSNDRKNTQLYISIDLQAALG